MAEIKIEGKKRGGMLPLILGAILLLLLLGWCAFRDRTTGTGALGDSTRISTAPPATAAREFITYVTKRDTAQETEGNHQYTAGGVRRLAAALEEVAGGNPNVKVYADSMRSSVDRLQRSADTDVHADDAKAAFSAAVSAMEQIGRARGASLDTPSMRAIYNDLSSQQALMAQLPVVQRFFEAARDALQGLGTAG
jgi:hypothetical protein